MSIDAMYEVVAKSEVERWVVGAGGNWCVSTDVRNTDGDHHARP